MLLFLVFFPMLAAVCSYLIGRKDKKLRDRAVQIFCLIEFGVAASAMGLVVAGKELSAGIPGFCGFGLSFKLDGFRALYALVAGVMWLMTSLLFRRLLCASLPQPQSVLFLLPADAGGDGGRVPLRGSVHHVHLL